MEGDLVLTGVQQEELQAALISAFPTYMDLARLVKFQLSEQLQNFAGGPTTPLNDITFNLIIWADSNGRLEELVRKASKKNPGNPKLKYFVEIYLAGLEERKWKSIVDEKYERIIQRNVPFADTQEWRDKMDKCELAVCRVEFPENSPQGTGFLISPNVVITNYHVIKEILAGKYQPAHIVLRFDYKKNDNNNVINGITYGLANDWLIDSSNPEALDYALLRVKERVGEALLPCTVMSKRGWIEMGTPEYTKDDPIFIIQHPRGELIKLTSGSIRDIKDKYIIHSANTMDGSSGSPCFNSNWDLIALHHYGDVLGNRAIRMSVIIQQLTENNNLRKLDA